MALTQTIKLLDNFNYEVSFPNTYIKIESFSGAKNLITLVVAYKKDAETLPFNNVLFSFTPDLTGINFIAQGYEYLKTLPEFSDAINC